MRLTPIALVSFILLGAAPAAATAAGCCDGLPPACCTHESPVSVVAPSPAVDSEWERPLAAVPFRQKMVVTFDRPTWIGRAVLMGKYVIEHDTGRMVMGLPCTYIYTANDLDSPVATLHCVHIDTERAENHTVTLITMPDGMRKFAQFQFAGEDAAHGYPVR